MCLKSTENIKLALTIVSDHNRNCNMMSVSQNFQSSHTQSYGAVLDLSRRRDSVETRKTPSPYHSSSFGDGSPSTLHDSPTTTTTASTSNNLNRSETPVNHFPLPIVPLHQYSGTSISQGVRRSPPAYPSSIYLCQPKRENISPHAFSTLDSPKNSQSECPDIIHNTLHHQISSDASNQDEHIRPYSIQAVALQKHIAQVHLTTSEESSEACSVNMMPQTNQYPMVVGRDGKLSRPFKAYPRDPLSITASFTASDTLMDNQSAEKYHSFRKRMLEQIHAANGGQPTISNPKMRRTSSKMLDSGVNTPATSPYIMPDCSKQRLDEEFRNDTLNNNNNSDSGSGSIKDSAYFERRKKNNAAAKKSRDRRRIKEDEIAIRAAFLERENIELKFELASARKQLAMYCVTTSS